MCYVINGYVEICNVVFEIIILLIVLVFGFVMFNCVMLGVIFLVEFIVNMCV